MGAISNAFDGAYKSVLLLGRMFTGRPLVGFLLFSLLIVSAAATLKGITDLVTAEADQNVSPLVWVMAVLAVIVITGAMWVGLERARLPGPIFARVFSFLFYLVCLTWSVGFGFGFWWSLLASRIETSENLDATMERFSTQLVGAKAQVTALEGQFLALKNTSSGQQEIESKRGGSCGMNSFVGEGPLFAARFAVTSQINGQFDPVTNALVQPGVMQRLQTSLLTPISGAVGAFDGQVKTLQAERSKLSEADRKTRFEKLFNDAKAQSAALYAASTQEGDALAKQLERISSGLRVAPGQPGFTCYDPKLAEAIDAAAASARKPIKIEVPPFKFTEGTASTAEAFRRLYGTVLYPVLDPILGKPTAEAAAARQTMTGRDWIALLATIIVDIGIVYFTLIRPREPLDSFMPENDFRGKLTKALAKANDAARDVLYELAFQSNGVGARRYYIAVPQAGWRKVEVVHASAANTAPDGDEENAEVDFADEDEEGEEAIDSTIHPAHLQMIVGLMERGSFVRQVSRPSVALLSAAESTLQMAGWECRSIGGRAEPQLYVVNSRDLTELRYILTDAPEVFEEENRRLEEKRQAEAQSASIRRRPLNKISPQVRQLIDDVLDLQQAIDRAERRQPGTAREMARLQGRKLEALADLGIVHFGEEALGRRFNSKGEYKRVGVDDDSREPRHTITEIVMEGFRTAALQRNGRHHVIEPAQVIVSSGRLYKDEEKQAKRAARGGGDRHAGEERDEEEPLDLRGRSERSFAEDMAGGKRAKPGRKGNASGNKAKARRSFFRREEARESASDVDENRDVF